MASVDVRDLQQLEQNWATPPGLLGWIGTVDHKLIGRRYLVTAFIFLLLGGVEALIMRVQLAHSSQTFLSPEAYNQLFTMHGVTMIFLYAAPILSGFSNFLWPLLVGSRDMAYPRLNALSYWTYLASGIFLYSSFLIWQAPNGGWFNYVPYTNRVYDPALNIDFYSLGLLFLTISTTVGSINFIVSLFKTRAPGMSINRLPILVWGTLTSSVINLFALPALSVACIFLYFDRHFGTHFYDQTAGGHPLLWQHLFWMFGHPWVYVIVLPAMGIISDLIPTFTRRPLVGYTLVALATVSTGILGFGVWVHHMFATGIAPLTLSFFSAGSVVISIPSAVAVFAWIATVYYGRPVFKTPFLFAAGFIVLFVMGGVSGVMTALVPFDWQLTDTYFVVAHLHYVLIGINVFPVIAGLYYWLPKITGRMLNERLGRWNFWTMFIGFNIAFFPMHIAGLLGMPRRIYTYAPGMGWDSVNFIETIGAFLFAFGLLLFIINFIWSRRNGAIAPENPWDAPTLEWATSSPPPPYNFAVIPIVGSRHPLWENRITEGTTSSDLTGGPLLLEDKQTIGTTPLDADPLTIFHMPEDSYAPICLAVSLTIFFYGALVSSLGLAIIGLLLTLATMVGWLWPAAQLPRIQDVVARKSLAWWAMVWTVVTEACLFAYFLFSYFYLGSMAQRNWPPAGAPDLKLAFPNTIILLLSSGTMFWAEDSAKHDKRGQTRLALFVTFILGVLFLVIQGFEYSGKSFGISHDAYSSLFYTITGFHGAHVAVGLIMNLFVQALAWRGYINSNRHVALSNAALYWHFVDAVWIFVFSSLYLVAR